MYFPYVACVSGGSVQLHAEQARARYQTELPEGQPGATRQQNSSLSRSVRRPWQQLNGPRRS